MITSVLTIVAAHLTWFHSNAPAHLFNLLHLLGLGKDKPGFWSTNLSELKFNSDWFVWINSHRYIPESLAELLTCPVCLSWHISAWIALLAFLLGLPGSEALVCIPTGVVACHVLEKLN